MVTNRLQGLHLMDALRRSVAEEKRTSGTEKRGRKRIEGQKEMLLPILGKKGKAAGGSLARH